MYKGIQKLVAHSKTSKAESVELDQKINILKKDVSNRKDIAQSRITFSNIVGAISGSVGVVAVESLISGEATLAICYAAAAFPPLGTIILSAAIGAISIGAILFLISKLWEKKQFKAIQYLTQILEILNK